MIPKIINNVADMQNIAYNTEKSIGFIPTMGFLHEGHLSLVKAAKKENDITVVSIYVNPTQFAPTEDLDNYPRNMEKDVELLDKLDVDYIFFPTNEIMYPKGYKTWVDVEDITKILCGKSRTAHFKGVTTVVNKLINIVKPTRVYFGEKDFQQLTVLRQMAVDLNIRVEIIGCPLVRETDGLAMSSRNKYLSLEGRANAASLFQSLQKAQELFDAGEKNFNIVKKQMSDLITNNKGMIDYIELVDSTNLESRSEIRAGDRVLLAVKIENTRLIDNMEIS